MNTISSYQDLTEEQLTMLPEEDDILFYEEHGWYVSPLMVSSELIDAAVEGSRRFYSGERDFKVSGLNEVANDEFDDSAVLLNNEFVTLQIKELQDLGFHHLIAGTAARLARTNEVRLFADSLINKAPTDGKTPGVVGWHTDKAYWPTCTSDNLLTAWIPFQDCTLDMGPLFYIDRSHHWKSDEHLKSFYAFNGQQLDGLEAYLAEQQPGYQEKPMLLKKGQVCFHNCQVIHASRPNTSKVNRMALAIHFQDETNEYQKAFNKDGKPIVIGYDRICQKDENGMPDYRDNEIFPVIWKN